MRRTARVLFPIVLAVWAGAIIGLSLIATPAKFLAPSLTMPAALEVGRYTFRIFANLELAFLIVAIVAAGLAPPRRITVFLLAAIAVQLLLQRFWLLPELDHRVSQILAGSPVVYSSSHWVYAVFEVSKSALLIVAAAIEGASRVRLQ